RLLLPPRSPLFPYTTLFRSGCAGLRPRARRLLMAQAMRERLHRHEQAEKESEQDPRKASKLSAHGKAPVVAPITRERFVAGNVRSEEHTSELQSRGHLVCRL